LTPYLPALTRLLLHLASRRLHGRERIAEERHDLAHLTRREVRRLRTLARADTEGDTIILRVGDRRVEHVHGREGLRGLVDTVLRVNAEGFDEGGEIRNRDLLRSRPLTTGKSEPNDGNAVVIQTDFDALTSRGKSGRDGGADEQLGHGDLP
jgi:hypothetical protein